MVPNDITSHSSQGLSISLPQESLSPGPETPPPWPETPPTTPNHPPSAEATTTHGYIIRVCLTTGLICSTLIACLIIAIIFSSKG